MMNREEHLKWCKDRALQYAETGDGSGAIASIMSDLGKHEETKEALTMMGIMMMGVDIDDMNSVKNFINGLNC